MILFMLYKNGLDIKQYTYVILRLKQNNNIDKTILYYIIARCNNG